MDDVQQIPDILAGELAHVATVAQNRTGRRPAPATVWRWCRQGLRGGTIKLAAVYHGGHWQTTAAAFDQFIAAQTADALAPPSASEPADSDAALIAAGLL